MRTLITATLVAVLLGNIVHAQTWLTDPAFGARRDAYGPGVHMDATGRAYRDHPSNAWVFEPVQPNAYGPGVGSDALGRPVVPAYDAGVSGGLPNERRTAGSSRVARARRRAGGGPQLARRAQAAARSFRKGSGLVDVPGEWLVGRTRNTRIVRSIG